LFSAKLLLAVNSRGECAIVKITVGENLQKAISNEITCKKVSEFSLPIHIELIDVVNLPIRIDSHTSLTKIIVR